MLIVAFGKFSMNRTQAQLWYNWFKEGREDVNDDARSGHLSMSTTEDNNIQSVKKIILNNRRIAIKEVVYNVNISFDSCQAIFTDVLCMKRAVAKVVLKLLNFKQK